jgi:pyridoxamine 5'-phosphate oxidase
LVGSDESNIELASARRQQWGNLSDPAREQFFWQHPGAEFSGVPSVPAGGRDGEGKVLPPPDNFLLLLLLPHSVKYLRLKDNLALRDSLAVDASWVVERVNP